MLAVIVIAAGFVGAAVLPEETEAESLLALPIVYVFMLAVVLLVRGSQLAANDRAQGESWRQRFLRSNSARLGLLIGGVFAWAGLMTVLDALGLIPLIGG